MINNFLHHYVSPPNTNGCGLYYVHGLLLQLFLKPLSRRVFSCFYRPVAIGLPRLRWLPVLDTCGTIHFDNKLPREGRYNDKMHHISFKTDSR